MKFPSDPGLLPTAVGSLPLTDPQQALGLVKRFLPEFPVWPQLPRVSFGETMYAQFMLGLPGLLVEGERMYVDTAREFDEAIRQLLSDYEAEASEGYAISKDNASGLHAFLEAPPSAPLMVKGQLTGPVSTALTITDEERRPLIYNDIMSDAIAKLLRLKAAWQEQKLKAVAATTMVWLDEPYMSSFGSGYLTLERDQVISLIDDVLDGLHGVRGVHCCGNTDWSVLLATSIEVINYDTYNFAETLSLYPDEVKAFMGRGGVIAWGIVPNEEATLARETSSSLKDRLEEAMAPFTRKGIRFQDLVRRGLLTPSCGLSSLSPEATERALEVLSDLSALMRKRYGG
ncbi:MAG: methionine synthase [Dehalococcoidia bacterium]|nr:methionine synthase [Dehalococcoidia bacterium]MDP6782517.1 methionine synthase [Dehalococcoidia bacterium]